MTSLVCIIHFDLSVKLTDHTRKPERELKQFHFQFAQALKAAKCKYAAQRIQNPEFTKKNPGMTKRREPFVKQKYFQYVAWPDIQLGSDIQSNRNCKLGLGIAKSHPIWTFSVGLARYLATQRGDGNALLKVWFSLRNLINDVGTRFLETLHNEGYWQNKVGQVSGGKTKIVFHFLLHCCIRKKKRWRLKYKKVFIYHS